MLAAVYGVDTVLKALVDAGPGPVRSSGTKALFEFGRQYPQLLRRSGSNVLNTLNRRPPPPSAAGGVCVTGSAAVVADSGEL